MKHNDISNERDFVIGFRCENSLLKYKDDTVIDKVSNAIKGRTKRAEIDPKVYSLMNYIYWNTSYTVVLVIDDRNYTEEAKEYLADFPFNSVVNIIRSISEVTMKLHTGELTLYVSEDSIDRYKVNSKYAVDVDTANTLIKRRVKRFEET